MPVIEQAVINLLTFQVWNRDTATWTDLADKATRVAIQRGARQTGAKVETQVGTLDATLYGTLDLRRVADLQPNSPIRVIRPTLPAALAWDLMPATASDLAASKALTPRRVLLTYNGAQARANVSADICSTSIAGWWTNYGTNTTTIAAGTVMFATPNTLATVSNPNNPKPTGVFVAGDTYTVRANVRALDASNNPRVQVVVFTGSPDAPTILAAGDPFTPSSVDQGTAVVLPFVAPASSDWNVGVVLADTVTASTDRTLVRVRIGQMTIWDTGRARPEFTGTISDLYQSIDYDKTTGRKNVYTTVQAVDAVQSLANTDRYGVIATTGAGYQSWADRIKQLATSATVPIDVPLDPDVPIFDQRSGGTAGGWQQQSGTLDNRDGWYIGGDGRGTFNLYHIGGSTRGGYLSSTRLAVTLIDGLTAASGGYVAVMTVTAKKSVSVTGPLWYVAYEDDGGQITYGDTFDPTKTAPQTLVVRFNPTKGKGRVGVFQGSNYANLADGADTALTIQVTDMLVLRSSAADPYLLQDVAYQGSLLNHLDLACNSVGARWYVTKRGTALFRRRLEDSDPGARFSDVAGTDVSYTDVSLGYDTRNVVNGIKFNQHGYDPASGNAADTAATLTDPASLARWGARGSDLDTCLYLGGSHVNDLTQRSTELFSTLNRPRYVVSGFTFNAQSNVNVLDALELRSTIAIDYEDLHQTSRVLGLRHEITPTRWMVTVDVNETRIGPRFSDFRKAGHSTFAAFNAKYRSTSFRDFNIDPLR